MKLTDSRAEFGLVTRWTHVTVLGLIVMQLFLGWGRGLLPHDSAARLEIIKLHESFGLILLVVAVFFVIWARYNKRPEHENMARWQSSLSHWVHRLLFILIVLEPVIGLSLVQLGGHPVFFFDIAQIPPLVAKHKEIGELLEDVHGFVAWCILVVSGFHALAAVYHHVIERDDVLVGMLPWRR